MCKKLGSIVRSFENLSVTWLFDDENIGVWREIGELGCSINNGSVWYWTIWFKFGICCWCTWVISCTSCTSLSYA